MYVLNLVPSKSVPKTPLELWNGCKPSLHHIRIWGCPAHVLKGKTGKLEPCSELCLFVGYPKGTRGGLFYSPEEKKVFVSTNAIFLEHDYMTNYKPRSKVIIKKLLTDELRPQSTTVVERQNEETTPHVQDELPTHRSGRVIRPPARYRKEGEGLVTLPDNYPLTYKYAMDDPDKEKWQEAMNLEMESMYSNSVLELGHKPKGATPIGCI